MNYNNLTASDREALRQGYYWDSTEADRIKRFIETFCLQHEYPFYGLPVKLMDWQWKLIRNLFSWKKPNGDLRYNIASIWIPKKNGKSMLLSCLCLYKLMTSKGSKIVAIAADKEQARIVYNAVHNFATMTSDLEELLTVRTSAQNQRIIYEDNKSEMHVMASTPQGKSGHRIDWLICDEISKWKPCYARTVWDELQGSNATKPNSLKLIISTADFKREGNLGWDIYQRTKQILAGTLIDLETFPCVYEVAEGADWTDANEQLKANPSAGVTFTKDYLRKEYLATIDNPHKENEFRCLRLNQWVSRTGYISSYAWGLCKQHINEKDLYGLPAFISCDWARSYDLAATCVIVKRDDKFYLLHRIWTPENLATEKSIADGVPYLQWAKQTFITLCPGATIENAMLRASIQQDINNFDVKGIRFDPRGLYETATMLKETNDELDIKEVDPQPATMSAPTAFLEKLVKEQKVVHVGNPCVDWCLSNVVLRKNAYEQIIPSKGKSRGRIDAIAATIIGLTGWLEYVDEPEIDYMAII